MLLLPNMTKHSNITYTANLKMSIGNTQPYIMHLCQCGHKYVDSNNLLKIAMVNIDIAMCI